MVAGHIKVRLNDIDRLVEIVKQLTQEAVHFNVTQESDEWDIEIERLNSR